MLKRHPKKILKALLLSMKRPGNVPEDLRSSGLNPVEASYQVSSAAFILNVSVKKIIYRRSIDNNISAVRGGDAARCRKIMSDYYKDFQPVNAAEVLGVTNTREWHSASPLGAVYPWSTIGPEEMILHKINLMKREAQENGVDPDASGEGFWKGFGPATEGLIDLECKRLISIYESISENGYQDSLGYIGGHIFTNKDEFMIRPKGGWHRTAVMIALGYENITMKFNKKDVMVSREQAKYWPNVKSGLYSVSEAVSFFDSFFVPLVRGPVTESTHSD